MFWYIVICLLMLYPWGMVYAGNISEKKTKHLALVTACMILWFFMSMRATSVGVDTKYYCHVFSQFRDISIREVFTAETFATEVENWTLNFEPGYRLYNKLISYISSAPQVITICNSTFIIILLYLLVKKESPNFLLSIWLYLTLGVFQTEMNVTRNAIAILIVYNSFKYVRQKQFLKYLILCLIAASFHKATLVFVPVYWLYHGIKWNQKRSVLAVVYSAGVGIALQLVRPFLSPILPVSLNKYFAAGNDKLESIMVGIFYVGIFLLVFLMMDKNERTRVFDEFRTGTLFFIMNLCCFCLNFGFGYAARMAALFGPYIIIFVPQMLSLIKTTKRKKAITVLIAIVCGCQYILRLYINNIGGTIPYQFFW